MVVMGKLYVLTFVRLRNMRSGKFNSARFPFVRIGLCDFGFYDGAHCHRVARTHWTAAYESNDGTKWMPDHGRFVASIARCVGRSCKDVELALRSEDSMVKLLGWKGRLDVTDRQYALASGQRRNMIRRFLPRGSMPNA